MKTSDFARYIHMGIVGRVYISDKSAIHQGFEIYVQGVTSDFDNYIGIHGRAVDIATGTRRQWSDLTRAYEFITESGWTGKVFIEYFRIEEYLMPLDSELE